MTELLAALESGESVRVFHAGPWLALVPSAASVSPDGYPLSLVLLPDPEGDREVISRGISTTVLRAVPLAEIAAASLAEAEASADVTIFDTYIRRYPMRRRDDVYYSLLASAYVSMTRSGDRTPMLTLADMTGANVGTVRGQVREAVNRGLLTRSPGRPGGELTAKARSVLEGFQL